jgi:hypothetical protein
VVRSEPRPIFGGSSVDEHSEADRRDFEAWLDQVPLSVADQMCAWYISRPGFGDWLDSQGRPR